MGVCLDVHSFVHQPRSNPIWPGSQAEAEWYAERWSLVALLFQHFGWDKLPWQEPSESRGADRDCFQWSTYASLLALAETRQPPHLASRNDSQYLAVYLPIDFDAPLVLPTSTCWETITVASGARVKSELQTLAAVFSFEGGTEIAEADWDSLRLCYDTFVASIDESLSLVLPLFVTW